MKLTDTQLGWAIVGGIVLVLLIAKQCSNGEPYTPPPYAPSSFDAYAMAKHFVTESLKAPKTAEFASYNDSNVTLLGDGAYEVKSYVDSQNSFGAMIRTRFVVKVQHVTEDKWRLVDFKTE